ncbi:MAG TPA: cytochrome c [Blastocatellia bacterium]|nr:cytochrome c [Blastocatellia bacterium]
MKRALGFGLFIGCLSLVLFAWPGSSQAIEDPHGVTFTKDVAPIIQKNCQVCHRPGEVAPMSLLSYKETRPWVRAIREKVASREMPPWFADPKFGEFSNDCRLSQKEIDTIVAWADGGAKEGNPADLAPNPKFTEGWQIGKPDVVLSMTQEFAVPTEGTINYKYFAIPTNFTEDKYVQFAEVRAGDRAHVHHVIVSVQYPGEGQLPAAGEISPAALASIRQRLAGGQGRSAEESDGRVVGWAPGEAPLMLRPGQAKLVKKGSVLILQVHYTTNGQPGRDRTSAGFIFSKAPVEKRVITAGAVAHNLVIPPGDPNYESTATFAFKDDSHIESLHPHMHLRGKDFLYRLVYPDGTSKVLLSVPRFDFGWQLTYFLKEPIAAPKGSRLEVIAHHDNSTKNKFNPDPTKEVRWGEQTWDEMMIGYLDYTVDKQDLRRATPEAKAGR